MELHITLGDDTPLRVAIYQQIRRAILDGRLRAGDALPPTRELAHRLKVSRSTIEVTYERLGAEGFVVSRVGAGTYVRDGIAATTPRGSARGSSNALRARPVWQQITLPTSFYQRVRYDFRSGLPDVSPTSRGGLTSPASCVRIPAAPVCTNVRPATLACVRRSRGISVCRAGCR